MRTDLEVHRLPGRAEALDLNGPLLGKVAAALGQAVGLQLGHVGPVSLVQETDQTLGDLFGRCHPGDAVLAKERCGRRYGPPDTGRHAGLALVDGKGVKRSRQEECQKGKTMAPGILANIWRSATW